MRFLTIFRPSTTEGGAPGGGQSQDMADYSRKMEEAGVLISQAMLDPATDIVRMDDGVVTVVRSVEQVAGYAFIEAASRDDAVENAKAFLRVAGNGVTEVRQVVS